MSFLHATLFIACKKNTNSGEGSIIKGVISLSVHAVHHTWDVPGIGVYLKTNSSVFPGKDTSIYEYKARADQYGKVVFENLLPGKYFIYASGYDSLFGSMVIGELPVSLYPEYLNSNHADITIQVSE
jgi:hypothetical protein